MSSKLLTVVFVVLFVLLIGEAVYLFFPSLLNPVIRRGIINQNQIQVKSILSPTPVQGGNREQAIGSNVLDSLSKLNVGILRSSTLKNHYEGIIVGIDNKHSDMSAGYRIKIKFKGSNNAVNVFGYSFDEVNQKMSVFITKQGKNAEKITVDDLKVGDSISIDEELNLLENDLNFTLLSVKITVNQ